MLGLKLRSKIAAEKTSGKNNWWVQIFGLGNLANEQLSCRKKCDELHSFEPGWLGLFAPDSSDLSRAVNQLLLLQSDVTAALNSKKKERKSRMRPGRDRWKREEEKTNTRHSALQPEIDEFSNNWLLDCPQPPSALRFRWQLGISKSYDLLSISVIQFLSHLNPLNHLSQRRFSYPQNVLSLWFLSFMKWSKTKKIMLHILNSFFSR